MASSESELREFGNEIIALQRDLARTVHEEGERDTNRHAGFDRLIELLHTRNVKVETLYSFLGKRVSLLEGQDINCPETDSFELLEKALKEAKVLGLQNSLSRIEVPADIQALAEAVEKVKKNQKRKLVVRDLVEGPSFQFFGKQKSKWETEKGPIKDNEGEIISEIHPHYVLSPSNELRDLVSMPFAKQNGRILERSEISVLNPNDSLVSGADLLASEQLKYLKIKALEEHNEILTQKLEKMTLGSKVLLDSAEFSETDNEVLKTKIAQLLERNTHYLDLLEDLRAKLEAAEKKKQKPLEAFGKAVNTCLVLIGLTPINVSEVIENLQAFPDKEIILDFGRVPKDKQGTRDEGFEEERPRRSTTFQTSGKSLKARLSLLDRSKLEEIGNQSFVNMIEELNLKTVQCEELKAQIAELRQKEEICHQLEKEVKALKEESLSKAPNPSDLSQTEIIKLKEENEELLRKVGRLQSEFINAVVTKDAIEVRAKNKLRVLRKLTQEKFMNGKTISDEFLSSLFDLSK